MNLSDSTLKLDQLSHKYGSDYLLRDLVDCIYVLLELVDGPYPKFVTAVLSKGEANDLLFKNPKLIVKHISTIL